ncbi:MAG: sugar phosphate isomerase/epimerase [Oscillospiraceae bacterium]|nr:sugar phosphate isomerase/epimerase [Oscillospiraceae bacterium]
MLAIYDYFGYDLAYDESCRLIAQAGFSHVMMWYGDDFGLEFRAANRPAQARAHGLAIENIHAPFDEVNHIWEDTPDGQRVFAGYLQMLNDCAAYDISTVVMHATRRPEGPPVSEIGLARWAKLITRAEQLGVNIAIENMRQDYGLSYAELLLERFDSPRFGFCFDSGHYHARRREVDWLTRWPARLMALHLHDNHGVDDEHLLPGDGTIDWPVLMRQIEQTGYIGAVALEVCTAPADMTAEEFLALAYGRGMELKGLQNVLV